MAFITKIFSTLFERKQLNDHSIKKNAKVAQRAEGGTISRTKSLHITLTAIWYQNVCPSHYLLSTQDFFLLHFTFS